ncbi:diguanylate cyclase [Bacillus haynesii]|uniref:diguanylate cyclase domain-containing protein n=1 Tax=Bacillus haynesii TaxID=1925021 RepID=UPI002281EA66|nr:diguanylate cyclase [Bacillus haynesii]MCY7814730.1 GGDEF domain-containing protein [Bacillus haynesii]MCY8222649.1 GGDEF domain-containing protein [Bacillus haynesii]MCY8239871.1 GGDEF domain-containing protein [Bacillus haynesii]MCY8567999.1 GGDEF domain-containing protein [Bacillus haynesii]MCY8663173.1 GGDEF domain-containing protein [Bacillus haynesii]
MKISFNESQKMFTYMTGLAAALALFIHYVSDQQSEPILIICITLAIIAAGIWLGSIYALAGTIIVLFVLGTLMMFLHTDASSETELQTLVIWGIALLLFSFMSGRIHDIAIGLHRSVKHLQDEIKSFVAIDRVTGFDNKQRMKLELSEEIKRAERYGNSFVFLLLQMHYFKEFKSLYGEKETDRLFQFVSSQIRSCVRETDKKFRPAEERFGILLTHTPAEHMPAVLEKLKKQLDTYQLKNGKYVTLTFHVCHLSYQNDLTTADQFLEELENEMMMNEL